MKRKQKYIRVCHSMLPWRSEWENDLSGGGGSLDIYARDGHCLATMRLGNGPVIADKDAALILRAVNTHEQFVLAARKVITNWETGDLAGAVRELARVLVQAEE